MKNPQLEISTNWRILRDEFYQIDPYDSQVTEGEKEKNLYVQEDLLLLKKENYQIDLGWYGENEKGNFQLYLYRGANWHNCELLEKIQTRDYHFLIKIINDISRNVDDKFYDGIKTNKASIDDFIEEEVVSKFQIFHTIIKIEDKVLALKYYLEENKNDNEGDSWIFGHNPNIEEFLKSFTKEEVLKLKSEFLNWGETELYHLADPISNTNNKFIDGKYLYGQIFLSIQDFEKLEYLIQNLVLALFDYETKRPIEFYVSILEKTKSLNKKLNNGYTSLISSIEEKIKREKADNK